MSRKKLLIVEDDAEFLMILGPIAKAHDYLIEIDMTGENVMEKARQFEPDLILLDIHLPKLNGLDLLYQLVGEPVLKDKPIVILSATYHPTLVQEALSRGAVDYFTKGGNLNDFFGIIQKYLA